MNLATISAVLNIILAEVLEAQFRRDAVLPNLLGCEPEPNATCTWSVKFEGRNTAGARAEGYAVGSGDFSTDARQQATLAWAHYESYAQVTGTAQRVGAANGRLGAGDALLQEELRDAAEELATKISQHTYSGSVAASPAQIEGLGRAVDSTGTYAGLAQSTYTSWASGEQTLALSALSVAGIRTKLLRPFKDATGRYPEFIVTDGTVYDALLELGDGLVQVQTAPLTTAALAGEKVDVIGLGFRYLTVDGVPVIEDRHCTSQTMYALDSRYLSYRQVPPNWTSLDPGQLQRMIKELYGSTVSLDEIVAAMKRAGKRIAVQINALGKTGDSTRLQMVADVQLRLKRRNAAAKLTLT
ncbi:MAG: phage major capsid protein [Deltaproteobacteria bacterium]|nr:phage major capsid protein [Deltaproteobacteria bacterium]